MLRRSRVLVTGGHGFIGARLLPMLAAAGAEIVAPHRPDAPPDGSLPGTHVTLDLGDPSALSAAMDGVEVVIHMAARSGGVQFQEAQHADVLLDNQRMTRHVLDAARTAGARRIFLASSGVVYSARAGDLIAEDDAIVTPGVEPVSGYAWSKLTDEVLGGWACLDGAMQVVVGRFTNVFGPGGSFDPERSTVVHALVRKAVEAAPGGVLEVWGDGSAVRGFVHVDDAARAVMAITERGASGRAYNIDPGQAVSVAELAELVRAAVDPTLTLRFLPDRPQGPARRVLDGSRLRALGWQPEVGLREGIAATVAAFRSGG
jgi:nucleoside-diphosphate-sugar epimerase